MFSHQNGSQPQFTSPATTRRVGNRSNRPVKIMYVNGVTAEKNRAAMPPTLRPGTSSIGTSSPRGRPPWLRWNETVMSASVTAVQSGSYSGSQ